MDAQEVIDTCSGGTDFIKIFYPDLYKQDQADFNITKILRDLKSK